MPQQTETPFFPPGHPDAPPAVVEAPPGMVWALSPAGERVLAYLPPAAERPQETGPPPPDVWPLRLAAGGGATAAVIAAVGYAGPGLGQAGHGVEMAGVGVGVACASVGALVLLVRGGAGRSGQRVEVNVNLSNVGNSSSVSSARSGRRR